MKKYVKTAALIAVGALVLELFVFNYRAFESFFYAEASKVSLYEDDILPLDKDPLEVAEELSGSGSYTVLYPSEIKIEEDGKVEFPEDDVPSIMIVADEIVADNLFLDVEEVKVETEEDDGVQDKLDVRLSATDEGNAYSYDLPKITIYQEEAATRYIRLNLSGRMNSLLITFPGVEGRELIIRDISLNVPRPFMVSTSRIFTMAAFLAAAWLLRPSSAVWRSRYSLKKNTHLAVIFLLVFLQVILLTNTTLTANQRVKTDYAHHRQYYKLAVALTEGRLYLEDEPSEALMAMNNPYDRDARTQERVYFSWDTAYFNGKYYCYFGILPVLTYYLPYYLVADKEFPAYVGILFHLLVTAFMLIITLDELFKQFFPRASLGEYIVVELSLAAASTLLVAAETLTFYVLPVTMGLMLTVMGVYFWLSARRRYRTSRIVMGAVCMALTAACRPQFAVASFLVFPLLGGETWRRLMLLPADSGADASTKENKSKKTTGLTAAVDTASLVADDVVSHAAVGAASMATASVASLVTAEADSPVGADSLVEDRLKKRKSALLTVVFALIPYIVVAAYLMYYNNARFGSPFDFGANYNLTTNDMTHRGFHLDRFPFGFFTYLLQPPYLNGVRPYMQYVSVLNTYQGRTIYEGMQGGLLWFAPLLCGNLLLLRKDIRRRLREKKLLHLAVVALLIGLFVAGFDIQAAGILQRYWMDFGFFFMLSSIICVLTVGEAVSQSGTKATADADDDRGSVGLYAYALCLFLCLLQMVAIWQLWMYRFL